MVRADGLARIPRFSEGVHAGAEVEVDLLRSMDDIRQTVVAIGSHDLALDLVSNALARRTPGASLASANVGSLGGLLALARGEAHLAGSHLLDEQTGEYNVSYLKQYLAGRGIVLVHLAGRVQGLIVPPGNPKGFASLADLARPDVLFVNRQRGSGTRVLLDYQLGLLGIQASRYLATSARNTPTWRSRLTWPVARPTSGWGSWPRPERSTSSSCRSSTSSISSWFRASTTTAAILAPLLDIIRGPEFRAEIDALGGYDVSEMGKVVWET